MARHARRTIRIVSDASDPVVEVTDPGAEKASQLIAAASANALPLDETIVRLASRLRHDFNYQAYRRREGVWTAYDELLEQWLEASASAVVYLQELAKMQQLPAPGSTTP